MSTIMPGFNIMWRYEGWTNAIEATYYAGVLDSDGNVILAGQQGLEPTSGTDDTYLNILASDFAAVKLLGESGAVAWQWTDKSSGSSGDQVEGVLGADTDSNNDVILGGFTTGFWSSPNENAQRNIAAVKLDGNTGDEIWRFQKVAQDPTSMLLTYYGSSSISGVAVDGYDNVFLVGCTYNSLTDGEGDPGDLDYVMVKLSGTTGTEIFTVQGGFSSYRDILHDAKVDSAGDVVAVGITGVEDQSDFFVVKLSGTNGSVLWEYSPPSTTIDVLHAVDFDDQDDVYVAGGEDTQNLQEGIIDSSVVMKLSGTNGTVEWKYSGTTTSRTVFLGVAVDPTTGWVVGAGYTEETWSSGEEGGANDFAAVVLDGETGEELTRFQNGTNGSDAINFAGFDSEGALFFGGYTYDMFGDQDLVGLKFSPLAEVTPTPSPTKPPTSVITYASVMPTPAPFDLTPTTPVSPTPVPVSPTPAPVSLTPALEPPTPGPVSLTVALVSATPAPESLTPAPKPLTPASDFPTSGPVSLTAILSSPTSTSEPQSPAPIFPTFTPELSTPSRKLLTPDTISPTTAPIPTLAPTTTTAGGAAVLDKWKIGVISAGASLALIIFALCEMPERGHWGFVIVACVSVEAALAVDDEMGESWCDSRNIYAYIEIYDRPGNIDN